MIEIQGRTTVSVEQYAVVLRKMELEPFVKVKLNRGIMKRSSSISFTELDGTKREYFFDDPYLDYRLTIHLDNNEFKATFLHLLDE
nr:hypothetical protein [Candidatus Njordarchaeum guaymaensis]